MQDSMQDLVRLLAGIRDSVHASAGYLYFVDASNAPKYNEVLFHSVHAAGSNVF